MHVILAPHSQHSLHLPDPGHLLITFPQLLSSVIKLLLLATIMLPLQTLGTIPHINQKYHPVQACDVLLRIKDTQTVLSLTWTPEPQQSHTSVLILPHHVLLPLVQLLQETCRPC